MYATVSELFILLKYAFRQLIYTIVLRICFAVDHARLAIGFKQSKKSVVDEAQLFDKYDIILTT